MWLGTISRLEINHNIILDERRKNVVFIIYVVSSRSGSPSPAQRDPSSLIFCFQITNLCIHENQYESSIQICRYVLRESFTYFNLEQNTGVLAFPSHFHFPFFVPWLYCRNIAEVESIYIHLVPKLMKSALCAMVILFCHLLFITSPFSLSPSQTRRVARDIHKPCLRV